MAGKFRQTKFDPIMIISQIAAMQCLLYLSAIVLMTVVDVVSGENFVLDHFTWHLFHLIFCWWYSHSFPTTFSWWLLNIACATLMCITGEFLCLKTELQEIPVGYLKLTEV
uniref:CSON013836 protein n=1 Tax=Culicoides sonorensis TaxID=179676 RepID=A0A336LNN5_CULSO